MYTVIDTYTIYMCVCVCVCVWGIIIRNYELHTLFGFSLFLIPCESL